jgi:hypothetical protein
LFFLQLTFFEFFSECSAAALVATYMGLICASRRVLTHETATLYSAGGIFAAWAILIESHGRRNELAMYVLPRALEAARLRLTTPPAGSRSGAIAAQDAQEKELALHGRPEGGTHPGDDWWSGSSLISTAQLSLGVGVLTWCFENEPESLARIARSAFGALLGRRGGTLYKK